MVNYNPKSNFVKNKIKRTKWKNREYINKLLVLEACALGKRPRGFADAMYTHGLKSEYEQEYLAIMKELVPTEYRAYLKQKQKDEREAKRAEQEYLKQEEAEEKSARESWKKAGGKF